MSSDLGLFLSIGFWGFATANFGYFLYECTQRFSRHNLESIIILIYLVFLAFSMYIFITELYKL
jgi:hypothetical protein